VPITWQVGSNGFKLPEIRLSCTGYQVISIPDHQKPIRKSQKVEGLQKINCFSFQRNPKEDYSRYHRAINRLQFLKVQNIYGR